MKKVSILLGAVIALTAPAGAASMMGMSGMQYYVGNWNCTAGTVGQPMVKATAVYTLNAGLLREFVDVPAQGKMKNEYVLELTTSYDAKNHRYVQTSNDNMGYWGVSYAKPWTGNTEQWMDHASADGKLGHGQTIRNSATSFSFQSYATPTSMKVTFKGSCTKA